VSDHYTEEGTGLVDATKPNAIEEARKRHHLASADPEPERDGLLTGPAHEEKYGLERAPESAALWRAAGVHPTKNRALVEGEDGAENLRGAPVIETADAGGAPENTSTHRASDQ
jgi:hypothetical protein